MTTAFTAMPAKITTSTMRFLEDMMAGTYANDAAMSMRMRATGTAREMI